LKAFPQFTREYIRDGISYLNLLLLQLSVPPYRGIEDGKIEDGEKKGKAKTQKMKIEHANQIFEFL
jgi:hypothetical protein